MPCCSSASCSSRTAFGPTPCSFFSSAAGTLASCLSSVYPAAISARVAGAPMFPGRPVSGGVMRWIVSLRWSGYGLGGRPWIRLPDPSHRLDHGRAPPGQIPEIADPAECPGDDQVGDQVVRPGRDGPQQPVDRQQHEQAPDYGQHAVPDRGELAAVVALEVLPTADNPAMPGVHRFPGAGGGWSGATRAKRPPIVRMTTDHGGN